MDDEKDYASKFLADAARRAHDAELAALANLALIRSSIESRNQIREERGKDAAPSPEELEERLRSIMDDVGKPDI